jgi:hypothetical protein
MFNWLYQIGAWLDRVARRTWRGIAHFVWPDPQSSIWRRLLPYGTLFSALAVAFLIAGAGWEVTNSNAFCGLVCHTMPPEYISYLNSPHSRVKCVECHIGRETIATQFTRKAHDISHVVKYLGTGYETPIYVKGLRPAPEICEKCHSPEKFSANSTQVIKRYSAEENNALTETHLSFKIGGGSHREGLGKGIHWHIENNIEYIFTDDKNLQQEIPWVRVTNAETGEVEVYTDVEADLPPDFVETMTSEDHLRQMDCVTCHNRNSHEFQTPDDALDDAMARNVISPEIPYFKQNAIAVIEREYPSMGHAAAAIEGLKNYYAANWPDYYADNATVVDQAVAELQKLYEQMVYPNMEVTWTTHPNNVEHKDWAGCFRCHDGKHLNEQGESVRIECNLCHTIPLQAPADGSSVLMALSDAYEPESHIDSNWIARHRFEFDATCQGCHDVSNPGGSDDTSFCANSACHATEWKFAGLDATRIVELTNVLSADLPKYPAAALTWDDLVGPILAARCTACHGGTAGLHLDSYANALAGGNLGPAIVPGDAEASLLVQLQREGHPNSLPPEELDWIIQWINAGAPES